MKTEKCSSLSSFPIFCIVGRYFYQSYCRATNVRFLGQGEDADIIGKCFFIIVFMNYNPAYFNIPFIRMMLKQSMLANSNHKIFCFLSEDKYISKIEEYWEKIVGAVTIELTLEFKTVGSSRKIVARI